jgi:hypothetical protein
MAGHFIYGSASAMISKGQGYRGLLLGREQFWSKWAFCVVARKNVKKLEKLLLGSIKCFSINFTHLRHLRWLRYHK